VDTGLELAGDFCNDAVQRVPISVAAKDRLPMITA
jgi:hypothetical protein